MLYYLGDDAPVNFSNVNADGTVPFRDGVDNVSIYDPPPDSALAPVKPPVGPKGFSVPVLPKWSHGPILIGGVLLFARIFTGPLLKKGK